MKKRNIIIIVITIGIITLLGICIFEFFYGTQLLTPNNETNDNKWIIKKITTTKEEFNKSETEMAIAPRWEEQSIAQQFYLAEYAGEKYDVRNVTISKEMIENEIGNITLNGYDTYTETNYSHNATCYMVKNYPTKCVIAIQYEGTNDYYVAINAYYRPETLGNLVKDLNLKETLAFGTIYYSYWDTDKNGNKQYENIEFPNVDNDIIWKMLFNDLTVKNVHDDSDYHSRVMSISVDIPILGYKNISVSVSEDGYLMTNIFETGKTFYIGKEKVQQFVDYIIQNYDGYKTVYVDENGNELSLDEPEENTTNEPDTIMVYDNTTNEARPYIPQNTGKNFIEPYNPMN